MSEKKRSNIERSVPERLSKLRVDACAFALFPQLGSRSQAKKRIRRGEILLNDEVVDSSRFVSTGDTVLLQPNGQLPEPLELQLPIIAEDAHYVVVNKPPGLFIRGQHPKTLVRALRHNVIPSECDDGLPMAQPVHRLDRRTSGLVVCAKTARAQVALGRAFQNRTVQKHYQAVVCGRIEAGHSTAPIDGKSAETRWRPLRHVRSVHTDWLTEIEVQIMTGRTHQIRRHLSDSGHPVLGDDLYTNGPVLKSKGLFLCATKVIFPHPIHNEPISCAITPPEKFRTQLEREAKRWKKYNPENEISEDN